MRRHPLYVLGAAMVSVGAALFLLAIVLWAVGYEF